MEPRYPVEEKPPSFLALLLIEFNSMNGNGMERGLRQFAERLGEPYSHSDFQLEA